MEYLVAWDFECEEITPDNPIPESVCMSYAWIDPMRLTVRDAEIVTAPEGHRLLTQWVADPRVHLVGANSAFDVHVDLRWNPDRERAHALWAQACEQKRVHDVLLQQGYYDLSIGEFQDWAYSLDGITLANIGVQLDKDEALRRSFGPLKGRPISEYTKRQIDYSKADAWATGWNWVHLAIKRREGSPYFKGLDMFADEHRRIKKAIALKAMENTGMRSNPTTVGMFNANVTGEIERLRGVLVPAGLVRRKLTRSLGAPAAYCQRMGIAPPKNFGAKTLANHPDPVLRHYRDANPPQFVIDAGLIAETFHDNDKAATLELASGLPPEIAAVYDWKNLRFSCLDGLDDKQKRSHWLVEKLEELRINLTPTNALKVDADACQRSKSRTLQAFGRYSGRKYTLTNPIKLASLHTHSTLHPFYRALIATGRTATSPNVQNMKREPGVRECWEAPPGWVIVDGDFAGVELCGFAEICYRVLGWSSTGDALNSGRDLHTEVGAAIMGITYEQGLLLKEADDFEFTRNRTAGKGVNFGAKGGMRARTFVAYCWNNYHVEITRKQAEELLKLHDRICKEFPLYSQRYAQAFARDPHRKFHTVFDIVQPYSGRLRAGCRFTDAHNSPFQGISADLAAETLWALWLETVGLGPMGKASPLYGCHLYLFVHDSFALLCPEGRHTAAALRLKEVAEACGRKVLAKCPPKVDLCVSRQLSKKAKLIKLPDGTFGVWDLWEQIEKADAKIPADVQPYQRIERLRKQEWPEYAIQRRYPEHYTYPNYEHAD